MAAPKALHYTRLTSPIITEKSTMLSEFNKVVFRVPLDATKAQVKEAVEALFNVNVLGVNTTDVKGKTKFFRGVPGKRSDVKKAIVTLKDGQSLDVPTGL